MRKGRLEPFLVKFGQVSPPNPKADAIRQAKEILDEVKRLHLEEGVQKVGITYSANQAQTDKILATYQNRQWETGTKGSNQAEVIKEIENLLKTDNEYKQLQNVFQIVPITTMKYGPFKIKMAADDSSVQKSLANAQQFIDDGGVLLGWRNQNTKEGELAIGGGVAERVQTKEQKQMIDDWVKHGRVPEAKADVSLGDRFVNALKSFCETVSRCASKLFSKQEEKQENESNRPS